MISGSNLAGTPVGGRLDSWKEIAAYLKRDPRTLQRWEKKEGLPVHRHVHESQVSIYAYTAELDAWLASRSVSPSAAPTQTLAPPPPRSRRTAMLLAAGCVVLMSAVIAVEERPGTPLPPTPRAFRQVWSADEVDYTTTVSPDGRYCSFTEPPTGNLWVRDVIAGKNRRITNMPVHTGFAMYPVFSPDGKSIAYAWWPPAGPWEVRLASLDGGSDRLLLRSMDDRQIVLHDWSENGKWIAATFSWRSRQQTQIALLSTRDGAIQVLKDQGAAAVQHAVFSPDSRYLAYDAPGGPGRADDIFLLSIDGREDRPLIKYPSNEFLVGFSPSGENLVFGSDRTGSVGVWRIGFKHGKTEGQPALLRADLGSVLPVAVTHSGSIFFLLMTGMADVYMAELGSRKPPARLNERLIGARSYPSFSPDGTRLLYRSDRGTEGTILVVRGLDAGAERQIHPQLTSFSKPRWAERAWAIDVWGSDGTTLGTWRVDPASGAVRLMEAGQPKPVYKPVEGLRGPGDPTPSPDGTMIAMTVRDSPKNYNTLFLVTPTGRRLRDLVRLKQPESFTNAIAWSPDSRFLYFARHKDTETELLRVPATGGRIESTGIRMDMIRSLSIHPDGSHIVFEGGERNNLELWALDGFLGR